MKRLLLAALLILLLLTSAQLWMTKDRTAQEIQAQHEETQVGGSFALTDQNGKAVAEADFRGRVMLVFFGFTHCPDVCPATVAALSKTMELLGEKADQVAPIFITVDPARDTPPVLKEYLANFDPHLVGLTGMPAQTAQAAELYKVYVAKQDTGNSAHHAHGEETDEGDFDHSTYIYLMDKTGKFIEALPYNADPQEITHAIQPYLG